MSQFRERMAGWVGALFGVLAVGGILAGMAAVMDGGPLLVRGTDTVSAEDSLRFSPAIVEESPDAAVAPAKSGTLRVYECFRDGVRVLSDQPCAENAAFRDVEIPTSGGSVREVRRSKEHPVAAVRSVVPQRSFDAELAAANRRAKDAECEMLEREKAQIDARMRAGYRGGEGEWLRKRWHAVDDRYRDLRCLRS